MTHPVGQKNPNPWALCDIHGNVWEWVQDTWHNNYNGAPEKGESWEGGESNNFRVFRGGAFYDLSGQCWSSNRNRFHQSSFRNPRVGFRLAKSC